MNIDINTESATVSSEHARMDNDVFLNSGAGAFVFDDRGSDRYHLEKSNFNEIINFSSAKLSSLRDEVLGDDEFKSRRAGAIKRGIRASSVFNEGVKYGAQAGYSFALDQFYTLLEQGNLEMLEIYNFKALMLGEGRIMPPVISLSEGYTSVSDSVYTHIDARYNISEQAKFKRKVPTYRDYLDISPSNIKEPNRQSIPWSDNELIYWANGIYEGWVRGRRMAHRELTGKINKLTRDYLGVVRYHILLKHGMVSNPVTTRDDQGVNSDGDAMDIGVTTININKLSSFNGDSAGWRALPSIDKLERRFYESKKD